MRCALRSGMVDVLFVPGWWYQVELGGGGGGGGSLPVALAFCKPKAYLILKAVRNSVYQLCADEACLSNYK